MKHFSGFTCFLNAFSFILKPKLRRFVYIPILINIIVYSFGTWLLVDTFNLLMNRFLPESAWLSFLRYILWPLFALLISLTAFYTFTIFANILAAPFNGWLAAQVELMETGKKPLNPLTIWEDVRQSIWTECHKIIYFGIRALGLLILTLLPVINVISPVLWFVFSVWMLSWQYMDYPLANHGIPFKQQKVILKPHQTKLLGFGATVSLMNMIPVINFVVMPISVITATLYRCRQIKI